MANFKSQKIFISYIGLTDRDITFIKNLFRLGTNQFRDYELISYSPSVNPNVVIINGDDPLSLSKWHQLKDKLTTILVSKANSPSKDQIIVNRPLVFRKLIDAFKEAENRDSSFKNDRAKILVVDDSLPIRRYMEIKLPQLANIPITIDYAENGDEAIKKSLDTHYDLIFLDVVMPGIDGYQVCRTIKDSISSFIVMLTSNKSPFDRVRGAMSGCDSYLTKPPKDDQLKNVFKKMIQKATKQNENLVALDSAR